MKRRLPLILAIAAFVIAATTWIVRDKRAPRHAYDVYSSANTSEDGTSYALAYLRKQGRRVEMLTRPVATAGLEANAVVFRITDAAVIEEKRAEVREEKKTEPKRELLTRDEEEFVRAGGRLVLAAEREWLDVRSTRESEAVRVFPLWPALQQFRLPQPRGFVEGPATMHAIFTTGGRIAIGRQRVGRGELFVVAVPEIFQNQHIGTGNRLAVVSALAGRGRPVYFDEVPHGLASADGAIPMLQEWGFGPFLVLLLASIALLLWRYGTRIGPPQEDYRDTRSEAVDLVRSLAALYQRATTREEALKLYRDALTRTVAAQSGLRGLALRKRVDALVDTTPADADFRTELETINDAFRKLGTGGKHANHR